MKETVLRSGIDCRTTDEAGWPITNADDRSRHSGKEDELNQSPAWRLGSAVSGARQHG
jgi:hypothetical protein